MFVCCFAHYFSLSSFAACDRRSEETRRIALMKKERCEVLGTMTQNERLEYFDFSLHIYFPRSQFIRG